MSLLKYKTDGVLNQLVVSLFYISLRSVVYIMPRV